MLNNNCFFRKQKADDAETMEYPYRCSPFNRWGTELIKIFTKTPWSTLILYAPDPCDDPDCEDDDCWLHNHDPEYEGEEDKWFSIIAECEYKVLNIRVHDDSMFEDTRQYICFLLQKRNSCDEQGGVYWRV